jgi:quercetin dioxygenase-like cupin family protein
MAMTQVSALPAVDVVSLPATRRARRLAPVLAMVSGLAVIALAATVTVTARAGNDAQRAAPAPVAAPADPLSITLSARDVSVVSQVYEPGNDSGWHSHSGIHAVAVLSGTLTVYDKDCVARTYEPGRPYVGGQELHLVRNETDAPVVMAVTYLNPSTGSEPTRHLPAPNGCAAGAH